jgi:hypothetical protein
MIKKLMHKKQSNSCLPDKENPHAEGISTIELVLRSYFIAVFVYLLSNTSIRKYSTDKGLEKISTLC